MHSFFHLIAENIQKQFHYNKHDFIIWAVPRKSQPLPQNFKRLWYTLIIYRWKANILNFSKTLRICLKEVHISCSKLSKMSDKKT